MRTPLVAGNWKMFKTIAEARHLVADMLPGLASIKGVDKVLCPPYTDLLTVSALLEGTDIAVGAQNIHWEDSGAYTGEISPLMVKEFCKYVILGHSERRQYFGETDEGVNRKVIAAIKNQLIPIVCIGETLAEMEGQKTEEVITRQVLVGLKGIAPSQDKSGQVNLVIAYEPVWAIGTGRAATPAGANTVVADIIRPALAKVLNNNELAQSIKVLYGGSVKAENSGDFFAQPEIDGALVGGASLKVDEFIRITESAIK
jgi:triosephosphate isomerase